MKHLNDAEKEHPLRKDIEEHDLEVNPALSSQPTGHLCIHFLAGSRKGEFVTLDKIGTYRFGRDPECEIHIGEPNVSRIHGQLVWDGEVLTVEDFRSTNGVYLNGEKVVCHSADDGDVITAGSSVYRVEDRRDSTDKISKYDDGTREIQKGDSTPADGDGGEHFQKLFECMLQIQRVMSRDSEDMIEQSLQSLFLALPVTRLCLLSVHGDNDLEPWLTTTRDGISREYLMSRTFARKVLEANKAVLIHDALNLDSSEWGSTMQQQEVRSILGVPVHNRTKAPTAILLCDNLEHPNILKDVHLQTLQFVSKALETVFQRDEFRRLEESQTNTERAFLAAKRVQKQIFTKKPSNEMGGIRWELYFQPALEVGGDFYDFHTTPEYTNWIIADVSGKGIPAALVVSMLKGFCKILFPKQLRPREFLLELNQLLAGELPPEMFLTALLIQTDDKGNLTFANAGHHAGLVLREKGKKIEFVRLKSVGVPLGFLSSDEFGKRINEGTVQLEKDDLICLYTDGVTETINASGQFLGEKGLTAELKKIRKSEISTAMQHLVKGIRDFQGAGHQHDDITVVLGRF